MGMKIDMDVGKSTVEGVILSSSVGKTGLVSMLGQGFIRAVERMPIRVVLVRNGIGEVR